MKTFDYHGQNLTESDIVRIAKRIQQADAPAVLSREEQQLIDDYRLMDRKAQLKVLKFVARVLDDKFMGY